MRARQYKVQQYNDARFPSMRARQYKVQQYNDARFSKPVVLVFNFKSIEETQELFFLFLYTPTS